MNLTDIRLEKLRPVLQPFAEQLEQSNIHAEVVVELIKKTLGAGNLDIKNILGDLAKVTEFHKLALYCMENYDHSPCMEYKLILAKAYGVPAWTEEARNRFWEK